VSKYYAHSGINNTKADWQSLQNHLQSVADVARHNASYFGADELASLAGLLHDLGKYTPEFQARLEGALKKVDHATAGAKVVAEILPEPFYKLISYAIAGHHAGLANGINEGDGRSTLEARLNQTFGKELCQLDNEAWRRKLTLPEVEQLRPSIKSHPEQGNHGFQSAFLIRMIFSCLVDADFIDTDKFYKQLEGKPLLRGNYPELPELKQVFDAHLAKKTKSSPDSKVNELRQEILSTARERAQLSPGLFTLTVPTGGGKTFSSMALCFRSCFATWYASCDLCDSVYQHY